MTVFYGTRPEPTDVVRADGEAVVFVRANIREVEADPELADSTQYAAEEYVYHTVWYDGLAAVVAANFERYLANAQAQEERIEAERQKLLAKTRLPSVNKADISDLVDAVVELAELIAGGTE